MMETSDGTLMLFTLLAVFVAVAEIMFYIDNKK